jgi:hypothetical protein
MSDRDRVVDVAKRRQALVDVPASVRTAALGLTASVMKASIPTLVSGSTRPAARHARAGALDRAGLASRVLIGRATMPDRSANAVNDRLVKLYRHGLVAQHTIGIRQRTRADGQLPLLYSLTRRGLHVAQARKPAPAISPKREWRAIEQSHGARG